MAHIMQKNSGFDATVNVILRPRLLAVCLTLGFSSVGATAIGQNAPLVTLPKQAAPTMPQNQRAAEAEAQIRGVDERGVHVADLNLRKRPDGGRQSRYDSPPQARRVAVRVAAKLGVNGR